MSDSKINLFYRGPQKECKNEFSGLVPVGLFNILYFLRKNGIRAELFNLSDFSEKRLGDFFKKNKTPIALISSFYGNHWESFKIADYIKKNNPDAITVLGGPLAVVGEDILNKFSNIDYIIYGEGEIPSLELISYIFKKDGDLRKIKNLIYKINGKIFRNNQYYHKDIDEFFYLPGEIRDFTHFVKDENFQVLITSRGCPFSCSFCSSPVIWGKRVRSYSIDNIIKYVEDLTENFGINFFSIRDDNFLADKKRVIEFCKEIARRRWKVSFNLQGSANFVDEETLRFLSKAGCDQIQIGIESLSLNILNLFNKKINTESLGNQIKLMRKYKIMPFGYFIAGADETEEDIEPTVNFIKNSGIMAGVLSPLVIYPGTELAEQMKIGNFFIKNKEILYYSKSSFDKYKSRFDDAFKVAVNRFF